MNDRLGRFGRRELTAAATLCTLLFGCFSGEDPAQYAEGNVQYLATAGALLLAWCLLELGTAALDRAGADGLGALLRRLPRPVTLLTGGTLAMSMLLGVTLLETQFLRAMTSFVYTEAAPGRVAAYLLPCAAVLAMLGMETLARTGRVLLPLTLTAAAIGLLSDVPLYRVYRLFPLLRAPHRLLGMSMTGLLRFVPTVLLLLVIAPGAQGLENVRRAGRRGLLLGGGITLLAELALGMSYRSPALSEMSAPLYRLLAEIDTENASVRLDRIVVFAWTMAGQFAAACIVYGASLLLMQSTGTRDVRPIAALSACASVTAATALLLVERLGGSALPLRQVGWIGATLPLLLAIALPKRRVPCEE